MKMLTENPVAVVSDWATGVYVRARVAWSSFREDDRGLTSLEVAVIAVALLGAAFALGKVIKDAVDAHSGQITDTNTKTT